MARVWLKTSVEKRSELEALSFDAEGLWHIVNLWCAHAGNDGTFPAAQLHVACSRKISAAKARRLADELIAAKLWESRDGMLEVVGWLDDQPAAAVWTDDTKRERWVRGKALLRDRALCRQVQQRDRNLCRYCGKRVEWGNRKGSLGGTYDHVDPDGGNTLDNVVVACRACNGRKKDRTPAQAGMRLLSLAEIERLARALTAVEQEEPAEQSSEIQPESDPDLTGIRSGSDPDQTAGQISLACARETGSGQTGSDRRPDPGQIQPPGTDPPERVHEPPLHATPDLDAEENETCS
jgi:5-methylcytosine-specific restriction endonuclease McrA